MAAAQPGQLRRIIRGRFFGELVERAKKMRRQHGRARSDPDAVEEIAARHLALHTQLTVLSVAHQYLPESSARESIRPDHYFPFVNFILLRSSALLGAFSPAGNPFTCRM